MTPQTPAPLPDLDHPGVNWMTGAINSIINDDGIGSVVAVSTKSRSRSAYLGGVPGRVAEKEERVDFYSEIKEWARASFGPAHKMAGSGCPPCR